MIYSQHMTKNFMGYEITEQNVESALRYLKTHGKENATRDEALSFLEDTLTVSHLSAHKIVEDVESGLLDPKIMEDFVKKSKQKA